MSNSISHTKELERVSYGFHGESTPGSAAQDRAPSGPLRDAARAEGRLAGAGARRPDARAVIEAAQVHCCLTLPVYALGAHRI